MATHTLRDHAEIERDRAERLAALERDHGDDPAWRESFAPGTFGCHEALHLASVLERLIDDSLSDHPAVVLNPRWFELASHVGDALAELYQEIGRAHLKA
ncbi:MAG: hypothetical protein ACREJ5_13030 [Geminicoccaceae bacterium]